MGKGLLVASILLVTSISLVEISDNIDKRMQETEELHAQLRDSKDRIAQLEGRNNNLHKATNELSGKVESLRGKAEDFEVEYDKFMNKQYIATRSFKAKSTAYTAFDEGMDGRGITYTGTKVKEGRTIAVDPNIIPLGSTVFVESEYPGITGLYIAEDIGGAIKGRKIDIYIADKDRALRYGKRKIRITILKEME